MVYFLKLAIKDILTLVPNCLRANSISLLAIDIEQVTCVYISLIIRGRGTQQFLPLRCAVTSENDTLRPRVCAWIMGSTVSMSPMNSPQPDMFNY